MSALHAWPDAAAEECGEARGYHRRKYRRTIAPGLRVRFRKVFYTCTNWSLGGVLVQGYQGTLGVGDKFEIDAVKITDKAVWPVHIEARVLRAENGELAAEFITLNRVAFDVLEGVLLRRPEFRQDA